MTSPPHSDPRSDAELIAAINSGDAQAFETLYFRYRDWVYRLAIRFIGHRDQALDVLQETFAYLLRKCPNLELTAGLRTFLYPVVKHNAMAIKRKSKRFVSDEVLLNELSAPPATQGCSTGDDLAAVLRVLPPEQRDTLVLRFVDDMTLREIAQTLQIPLGTVKSRLHKALNTLREDERTRDYFYK